MTKSNIVFKYIIRIYFFDRKSVKTKSFEFDYFRSQISLLSYRNPPEPTIPFNPVPRNSGLGRLGTISALGAGGMEWGAPIRRLAVAAPAPLDANHPPIPTT